MKSILFLTTLNLACNPRLVKEVELALNNNYKVSVICFELNNWSKKNNDELIAGFNNVHFLIIPAGRQPLSQWINSVLNEKFFRILGKIIPLNLKQLSSAVSRRSKLLLKAINNITHSDLVIGHNPGAMYPAIFASQKFKCYSGFDMEDYHAGEGHDKYLKKLTKDLTNKLLNRFNYVSFASELIMKKTINDTGVKQDNCFTVLNYFLSSEFKEPIQTVDDKIKLVWFSQHINSGRGLEEFLELFKNSSNCELHLYGRINQEFYKNTLSKYNKIIIHEPLSQKKLHEELSGFDIGLSLDPAIDENRDIAVTNKILAYLQSGLFILASNISSNQQIIISNPSHGVCFKNNRVENEKILSNVLFDINKIRSEKIKRFQKSKDNCWENESLILSDRWNELLS